MASQLWLLTNAQCTCSDAIASMIPASAGIAAWLLQQQHKLLEEQHHRQGCHIRGCVRYNACLAMVLVASPCDTGNSVSLQVLESTLCKDRDKMSEP